ncbi:hypothetical protein BK411_02665 [Vibrio splendidus]|nr:hypothetical protein BK411_02665 [Vibrio splendidus]
MKAFILASALFSSFALAQTQVLMIGTSHDDLGNTGNKTGVWLSELSHAYDHFSGSGVSISFASIDGEGFPLDPGSLAEIDDSAMDFLISEDKRNLLNGKNVLSLDEALGNKYDAVYLIGGHGVMWDFKGNQTLDLIIEKTYNSDGVIGAVCHGVAGLLTATDSSGKLLIEDKKITGFSDEEEEAIQLSSVVPFSLEEDLKQANADYSQSDDNFSSYVVVDHRIVTGQNPASAAEVAVEMVKVLESK